MLYEKSIHFHVNSCRISAASPHPAGPLGSSPPSSLDFSHYYYPRTVGQLCRTTLWGTIDHNPQQLLLFGHKPQCLLARIGKLWYMVSEKSRLQHAVFSCQTRTPTCQLVIFTNFTYFTSEFYSFTTLPACKNTEPCCPFSFPSGPHWRGTFSMEPWFWSCSFCTLQQFSVSHVRHERHLRFDQRFLHISFITNEHMLRLNPAYYNRIYGSFFCPFSNSTKPLWSILFSFDTTRSWWFT